MKSLAMTPAGFEALQHELQQRLRVDRPDYVSRLQQAMTDDGNLSENAAYQAIVAEQASNESRIAELEGKLARAEVIHLAQQTGDAIRFGATVTLIARTGSPTICQIFFALRQAKAWRSRIDISSERV